MTTPLLAAQSLDKLKAASSRPMIGKKVTTVYQKKGKTIVEEKSVTLTGLEVGVGGAVVTAYILGMYFLDLNPFEDIAKVAKQAADWAFTPLKSEIAPTRCAHLRELEKQGVEIPREAWEKCV